MGEGEEGLEVAVGVVGSVVEEAQEVVSRVLEVGAGGEVVSEVEGGLITGLIKNTLVVVLCLEFIIYRFTMVWQC